MRSAKQVTEKAIMTLEMNFGYKIDRSSPLELFKDLVKDLREVKIVLDELMTVSEKNPAPHILDA